jgi:hypothetical protein
MDDDLGEELKQIFLMARRDIAILERAKVEDAKGVHPQSVRVARLYAPTLDLFEVEFRSFSFLHCKTPHATVSE